MSTPGGSPTSPEVSGPGSVVSALLPNLSDSALDELANATFIDNGVPVRVSPVDQLLMAFARRLLTDQSLGGAGVVQLPHSKHRSAPLLAITSHLLCRQPPARLAGPVVLIRSGRGPRHTAPFAQRGKPSQDGPERRDGGK